jgi:hypothetical protein
MPLRSSLLVAALLAFTGCASIDYKEPGSEPESGPRARLKVWTNSYHPIDILQYPDATCDAGEALVMRLVRGTVSPPPKRIGMPQVRKPVHDNESGEIYVRARTPFHGMLFARFGVQLNIFARETSYWAIPFSFVPEPDVDYLLEFISPQPDVELYVLRKNASGEIEKVPQALSAAHSNQCGAAFKRRVPPGEPSKPRRLEQ